MLVLYHSRQFAMSHGSYNSNLGPEILILVGDIRSRSWPHIGDSYSTSTFSELENQKKMKCSNDSFSRTLRPKEAA